MEFVLYSQVPPDPYAFAQRLKAIVNDHSPYLQALMFFIGERKYHLSRKTIAGIVGRDNKYIADTLRLLDGEADGALEDLPEQITYRLQ